MIRAVPLPAAVTSPVAFTVATAVSLDDQATPTTACPFASNPSVDSLSVSPKARNARASADSRSETACCLTVKTAPAEASPEAAKTVARPVLQRGHQPLAIDRHYRLVVRRPSESGLNDQVPVRVERLRRQPQRVAQRPERSGLGGQTHRVRLLLDDHRRGRGRVARALR